MKDRPAERAEAARRPVRARNTHTPSRPTGAAAAAARVGGPPRCRAAAGATGARCRGRAAAATGRGPPDTTARPRKARGGR
eukprot:3358195-Alexandrium_andersonii.AAC.1